MPEITETLLTLNENPSLFSLDSAEMKNLERFFVIMYKKSYSASTINEARHQLFTSGSRNLEALPPTQAALFEHIK